MRIQSTSSFLCCFWAPSEAVTGVFPVLGLVLFCSPPVIHNIPGVLFLVTQLCDLGAALTAAFDVGALEV